MVPAQQMWQSAHHLPAPPRQLQRRSPLAGSEALKVRASCRQMPNGGLIEVVQDGGYKGLWLLSQSRLQAGTSGVLSY